MGSKIESLKEDEPLDIYYPLVSDFFTVYNGNSFLIGNIQDNDLRKQIIKTYTISKSLVDSFRMNNDLVNKFEHAHKIYEETQKEMHRKQAEAHYLVLKEYAKSLKQTHRIMKEEISNLLRLLRKHGVLSEKQ